MAAVVVGLRNGDVQFSFGAKSNYNANSRLYYQGWYRIWHVSLAPHHGSAITVLEPALVIADKPFRKT